MNSLSHSMVVGVYQSPEIAKRAINELLEDGYSRSQINIRSKTSDNLSYLLSDESALSQYGKVTNNLDGFFHGMTDGESHDQILSEYGKVLDAGDMIISVDTSNDLEANKVASLLSQTAIVASEHTATSPKESDESDTGAWSGVKIFKDTKTSH